VAAADFNHDGNGVSCKVSVTFTPGAKGTRTVTVEINDNGGGSPQGVLLRGLEVSPSGAKAAVIGDRWRHG
jgi:hypothetical protein